MHRSPYRASLIALILAVGSLAVAACGSSDNNTTQQFRSCRRLDVDRREARGQEDQGRARHRHRRPQRPLVQRAGQQGPRGREGAARHRRPRADLEVQRRLHAEPEHAGPAEVRPRHRGRLPHGRRHREGRQEVPRREVRDHRLVRGGHEEQAQERRGPAVRRAGGRLPRRLPVRACTPRTTAPRRSAASAGSRSRRSTTTSRASRPAPRPPIRGSRRSTATRRTSSTRRSARRSRWTRSPRAPRSSSRSPASAASASSTRPRRRASRASAWTPTRPTWARRCSPAR